MDRRFKPKNKLKCIVTPTPRPLETAVQVHTEGVRQNLGLIVILDVSGSNNSIHDEYKQVLKPLIGILVDHLITFADDVKCYKNVKFLDTPVPPQYKLINNRQYVLHGIAIERRGYGEEHIYFDSSTTKFDGVSYNLKNAIKEITSANVKVITISDGEMEHIGNIPRTRQVHDNIHGLASGDAYIHNKCYEQLSIRIQNSGDSPDTESQMLLSLLGSLDIKIVKTRFQISDKTLESVTTSEITKIIRDFLKNISPLTPEHLNAFWKLRTTQEVVGNFADILEENSLSSRYFIKLLKSQLTVATMFERFNHLVKNISKHVFLLSDRLSIRDELIKVCANSMNVECQNALHKEFQRKNDNNINPIGCAKSNNIPRVSPFVEILKGVRFRVIFSGTQGNFEHLLHNKTNVYTNVPGKCVEVVTGVDFGSHEAVFMSLEVMLDDTTKPLKIAAEKISMLHSKWEHLVTHIIQPGGYSSGRITSLDGDIVYKNKHSEFTNQFNHLGLENNMESNNIHSFLIYNAGMQSINHTGLVSAIDGITKPKIVITHETVIDDDGDNDENCRRCMNPTNDKRVAKMYSRKPRNSHIQTKTIPTDANPTPTIYHGESTTNTSRTTFNSELKHTLDFFRVVIRVVQIENSNSVVNTAFRSNEFELGIKQNSTPSGNLVNMVQYNPNSQPSIPTVIHYGFQPERVPPNTTPTKMEYGKFSVDELLVKIPVGFKPAN